MSDKGGGARLIEEGNGRVIQSLARAINIMEYLATFKDGEGLSNISRGIGLSKSTTHSLITTLEKLGYVQQDQVSGRYSLGLKLFELGQVVHANMDLRSIALPNLLSLVQKYQETVHLSVLSKGEVVYIDKVDSPRSISIISQVGGRNPAHCTGVGKVLLAGLSEQELNWVLREKKLQPYTANTITDLATLKQCLNQVKVDGSAMDREELEIGLICIAAPVKNHQGAAIAAISLSGPSGRIDGNIQELTREVINTAMLISTRLGFKG
jgi:DNA-binding IclR family transcriptional regulator